MKTVTLFAVLAVVVCLVGCEAPELATCQQEKDLLQGQLDKATASIEQKELEIEEMKAENIDMQNKVMESISTMMTKQANNDKQIKAQIVEKTQQVKDLKAQTQIQQQRIEELEKQIAEHQCSVQKATDTPQGN